MWGIPMRHRLNDSSLVAMVIAVTFAFVLGSVS